MTSVLPKKEIYVIGVISDTHGNLPPEVFKVFDDVDLIIHAGDIGGQDVLDDLNRIAPVIAVRGNMDAGGYSSNLDAVEEIEIGNISLYILHDVQRLNTYTLKPGSNVIIHGHTHRPSEEQRRDALYLNPGSAGQPRHRLPPSVALLYIRGEKLNARFIKFEP